MAEADENFTTNLYIFLDLFGIKIPTTVNSLSTMKNYDLAFRGSPVELVHITMPLVIVINSNPNIGGLVVIKVSAKMKKMGGN